MDKTDLRSALWNLDSADVAALITQVQNGKSIGDLILLVSSGIIPVPAIEPADGTLANSQMVVWVDEGAGDLKFKLKKSNGSIVVGVISVNPA